MHSAVPQPILLMIIGNNDYDHNDLCDNHDDNDHDVPSDNCDHQNHSHHESSLSISLHNGPSTNFAN